MTHLLRDQSPAARPLFFLFAALVLACAGLVAQPTAPAEAAPPGAATLLTAAASGEKTHTDIVLSDVGPAPVPAETRIDSTVTQGETPVAVGQVQFIINGKQFGAPVPVEDGLASLRVIQGIPGTYTISARYTGYSGGGKDLQPSASADAVFEVTEPAVGCLGTIECDTEAVTGAAKGKPSGVVIISTPYTEESPLTLPPFTMQQSATCVEDPSEYGTDAPFAGISITDTRAGQRPWTASLLSEDLLLQGQTAASASARQRINSQNVGLTNLALTSTSSPIPAISTPRPAGSSTLGLPINFTIFNNPSAEHLQGEATGTLGLGGAPKRIIHANKGFGTSMFVGTMTITAPTNTVPGTYLGRVTFTVLGS